MSSAERQAARCSDLKIRYEPWQKGRPADVTPEEWELKRPRSTNDIKEEWQLRRPPEFSEDTWEARRERSFAETYLLLFKWLWGVSGFALGVFAGLILTALFTPEAVSSAEWLRLQACQYIEIAGKCEQPQRMSAQRADCQ